VRNTYISKARKDFDWSKFSEQQIALIQWIDGG